VEFSSKDELMEEESDDWFIILADQSIWDAGSLGKKRIYDDL
jgi:hypothetical protein